MNKKIFTLLAGAFLMFVAVFSIKAQGPMWSKSRLSMGDSVRTLIEGYNPGYYHLRVDSIVNVGGGFTTFPDSAKVLYMGKADAKGNLQLFVDSLGSTRNYSNNPTQFTTTSKAEFSAASLWCVSIDRYNQGKNITFDFINKQQEEMLEVDVFGYENWTKTAGGVLPTDLETKHASRNVVPGGVSGWEFSGTYATMLESRPLISYITPDTVAVLCMNPDRTLANGLDSVYVKIASATDVQNRLVSGVIYFRLMKAAPFIIDVVDYNTVFGTKANNTGRLVFNGDVSQGSINPFSQVDLKANYLNPADKGMRIVKAITWTPYGTPPMAPPMGMHNYDTVRYTGAMLDSLGYLSFTSGTQQVQVKREYFSGNQGGNQFLKVELGTAYNSLTADSLFYGQYAFRMVYYPSGDSIYINPYQATYLPLQGSDAQKTYLPSFNPSVFTDSVTLSVFTYYADTAALQNPKDSVPSWSGMPGTFATASNDELKVITARLKYGKRTDSFYETYSYWQRLYVSLQDLNGARRLTLNSTANVKNNTINTRINFGLYTPCGIETGSGKVTVAPDVYLIRNTAGQYLQVPLYSATDSALWVYLDKDVDPRYVPSFHWVVQQRYTGSNISPVKITNREFEWLEFDNVQLYDDIRPITLRNKQYFWNTNQFKVNAKVTDWAHKDTSNYGFIKVDKAFKSDPLLGYTWVNPDTSVVSAYAFQYRSGVADRFLGWDGDFKQYPNTDTLVYVNYENNIDKLYFTLDTIHENGYGDLATYGFDAKSTTQIANLVTLKRQPYRLTYQNPFKYTCVHEFCMSPDENKSYSITKKGYYKDFLGKPVFYLRHVYKRDGQDPYFALVQRIDSTTTGPSHTQDTTALRNYLEKQFGIQFTNVVMERLKTPETFNPGVVRILTISFVNMTQIEYRFT